MSNRTTRIAVSTEELDRVKKIKQTLWPRAHDSVPHADAVMRLIDEFEDGDERE
jgi:hypothetical protein